MHSLITSPAEDPTNSEGQARQPAPSHFDSTTCETSAILPADFPNSSPHPMHQNIPRDTIRAREHGMARALGAASPEDKAAITNALLTGFRTIREGRAEDAIRAAQFHWPESAPPRCLGAIVAYLGRTGIIAPLTITKGLSKRSHAGRTTWWRWCGEDARHG